MASKVRPVIKPGKVFSLFGVMHQVKEVIAYSDWVWKVIADVLDGEPGMTTTILIPTDYRTSDGVWVDNV